MTDPQERARKEMPNTRDEKGLTLALRTILRLCLEVESAQEAGGRVGRSIPFTQALMTPQVSEQAQYLDLIGKHLLSRYPDQAGLLKHLDDRFEEDLQTYEELHERLTCSECKLPLCSDCGNCHACNQSSSHETKKKPPELN